MDFEIFENERIDNTGFGNIRLIQKPEDFCYGVDAVLLADFAKVKKDDRVMDMGTGTGIIPLILSHKTEAFEIFGIEVQEGAYRRGLRNIKLNGLEDRIKILNCNVKDNLSEIGKFQAVTCNPPYVNCGSGLKNKMQSKTIARHEVLGNLKDFIKCASSLLTDKGSLFMVYRPSRIVDLFCTCREFNLEPKRLRLISPKKDAKPNLLLMEAKKLGGSEMEILKPFAVYNEDGDYSDEIKKIYGRE